MGLLLVINQVSESVYVRFCQLVVAYLPCLLSNILCFLVAFAIYSVPDSQGSTLTIQMIHTSSVVVASLVFFIIVICSILACAFKIEVAGRVAITAAKYGLLLTILSIVTNVISGSFLLVDSVAELMLLLMYLAYGVMIKTVREHASSKKVLVIVSVVSVVNISLMYSALSWSVIFYGHSSVLFSQEWTSPLVGWILFWVLFFLWSAAKSILPDVDLK